MDYEVELPERLYKSGYAEAWNWQARLVGSVTVIGSGLSMKECLALSDQELGKFIE